MGFQSVQSSYKPSPFCIYYGLSTTEIATEATVLSLQNKSTEPHELNRTFTLNAVAGQGNYMYWASPVSYGRVQFQDLDNSFYGGWDGAQNDIWDESKFGPITINVTTQSGLVIPYFVYRTDYPDLGVCNWKAEPNTGWGK